MRSLRHGLRVLQRCDVSWHDWLFGQILCNLPSTAASSQALAHAILIDFSATIQTVELDVDLSSKDGYELCVSTITHIDVTGLDPKWVFAQWEREDMKRESWDTTSVCMSKNGHHWSSRPLDPYKFVYEHI